MRILSLFLGLLLAVVSIPPASAEDSFTLAVLPDTQGEIHANGSPTGIFFQRNQWLLSNRSALNLKCMIQVGDLVNFYNYRQYEAVSTGLKALDDAGLPYTMALGNHDTAAVGEWTGAAGAGKTNENVRVTQYYNSYFPLSRFTLLKGVYEADKIDNAWHTFSAGDLDWLVLNLELWPRAAVYDWAKAVIASHPNHNVIIVTHAYMNSNGSIQQDNGGYGATSPQVMFDQVVKPFANVRFVFCGHVGHANNYRVDTGTNGNKIYSYLQDEVAGKGMTRLITINTKTGTIGSKMHSVVDNAYLSGASNFTVSGVSWVPRNTPAAPRVVPPTPARKTVNPGQTATFTVKATGTPAPTFQWQKNGANISGATSASYTTPAIASGDNGAAFRCVVTNSAGTATSSTAIVKTSVAPAITTQPISQTAAVAANVIFFVNVSGDPWPTYQWQRNGVDIPGNGAKAPRYEIRGVVAGDHGAVFRCVVSSIAGTVTSNNATLSVSGVTTSPPTITSQPTSQTRAVGQTATFTVAANGAPAPTYQWQRGTTNISGATSASYTTPALTSSDNGATFRCVVRNSVGSATSNAATLTVTASTVAPTITAQPVAKTVNVGQTASFSVVATGTPAPTYQWQRGTTNISGANSASYTTPATVAGDNGATFRCVVSNSAGTATSTSATLTVNVPAQVGNGTGLTGMYFDNQDLTGTSASRTDAQVDFTWADTAAPISGIAAQTYSVRWAGQVQAQYSQTYTFFTTSDDGVRLWVNGRLMVDQWNDHGPTEHSNTIALTAGTKYDIALEFYQAAGGARIALAWSSPSTAKQIVPTTQLYTAGVPSPWAAQDLGSGTQAGGGYVSGDTVVVTGAGGDIYQATDGGRLFTQPLSGDATIVARVVSMTNTNVWAKAGLMIREGTAANAKHAFCFVTPVTTNGVGFIRRTSTGAMSTYTGGSKSIAPRWLRLVRSGSTITASESANGTTWTTVGTVTVSMTNPVQIGFAVTAGDNSKLCTAVFDMVSITPAGNG